MAALEAWLASVREAADPDFPDREQPPMLEPGLAEHGHGNLLRRGGYYAGWVRQV
jgi:hypothetical protein